MFDLISRARHGLSFFVFVGSEKVLLGSMCLEIEFFVFLNVHASDLYALCLVFLNEFQMLLGLTFRLLFNSDNSVLALALRGLYLVRISA